MAGSTTNAGEKIGLDAITGRATQTARSMFLALLTAAPSDTTSMATMTELTTPGSNGYDREAVAFTDPGTSGETENTAEITFGPFSSDLGNVTHVALVSASTGTSGDLTFYWTAAVARDPANGDSITIAAGALTIALD